MKQRITKQQWLERLAEQEQSGLTVAAFCRSKNISAKNFYNHARKARLSTQQPPAFVRARVASNVPAPSAITLLYGKSQLNLTASVSPQWLASLLLVLP